MDLGIPQLEVQDRLDMVSLDSTKLLALLIDQMRSGETITFLK